MKVVVQRVKEAEVWVEGVCVSKIGWGLLLLVGFRKGDTEEKIFKAAKKVTELRIFEDEQGKMNLSVKDLNLEILAVPNFTLEGSIEKGRRPSFDECMEPDKAREFFERFCLAIKNEGVRVSKGVFQAKMEVKLVNYGPVTFVLSL
uniref:D-aminoacyl-tRNA deacylase n=1 Tax=candidate division WOR-3 bacterium TaxID=2052148 RepID=A0A7V3ZX82_UNCW3